MQKLNTLKEKINYLKKKSIQLKKIKPPRAIYNPLCNISTLRTLYIHKFISAIN